jgi:low temperature requirement protein LtrA
MSRALLTLQYIVVLIATMKEKYNKLYLPLIMNIVIYLAATVIFVAMTPAFKEGAHSNPRIYVVWYITMVLETVGSISISCCWKMLSFKKTHLVERMGLLTLIVIGEGAIGVTKTVSRMMGQYGLNVEGSFLVICIILVLVSRGEPATSLRIVH